MYDLRYISLAIVITILTAVFLALVVDAIYSAPNYSDYCNSTYSSYREKLSNVTCENEYDENYYQCVKQDGLARFNYTTSGCRIFDKCDFCEKDFNAANKIYAQNVSILISIIAIGTVFIGVKWKIRFLASGIMFGGFVSLLYFTIRYFYDMDRFVRVFITFVDLLVVLVIGYLLYKANRKSKNNHR